MSECCCAHEHCHSEHAEGWKKFINEIISSVLMILALLIPWNSEIIEIIVYIIAILPVGVPIIKSTFEEWRHGDFFNEFTLMLMAAIGAFCINEYPESVAILLFYSLGEKLEDIVSDDVKGQIKKLLGKIPKKANIVDSNGNRSETSPENVKPGMVIAVRPGEAVALDGLLINNEGANFNTAAITGESMPRFIAKDEIVNSGTIPFDREVLVRVTHEFKDSSMSRIIDMIEDASSHRAPSETMLRKITRYYTPVVFIAALLLFIIPWFISLCNPAYAFEWSVWMRRSLVFLVCSCPCALIISIPLTYFASIGIASKKGILFKGNDSLDTLRKIDTVFFDKTGTVTTGEFHVDHIIPSMEYKENDLLSLAASIEMASNHPIAKAIRKEADNRRLSYIQVTGVITEDHGIKAIWNDKVVILGSSRIFRKYNIEIDSNDHYDTTVCIAVDGNYAGSIILSDTVKDNAGEVISLLHSDGISEIGILSGDNNKTVCDVGNMISADSARGMLLPEDKMNIINDLIKKGRKVAFAGDGINDAPALAASNLGIAMGGIGSDMAIESAGVVIAGDNLLKIHEGFNISRQVRNIIIENVGFAFGIKLLVMILGAFGIATLWAAVFADTGVTLLTVLWTLYRLKIWQIKIKA